MGKIKKILLVAAFALFTVFAACVGVSAQETAEENTDENLGMIYIKEITDDGNHINYGSLHEAIDVANASELDELTIVVKGEVPFDRKPRINCTCGYKESNYTPTIYVEKNILIIAEKSYKEGGKIFFNDVNHNGIILKSGKTINIGSNEEDASPIIIEGGAIWDDNNENTIDYARYDKIEDTDYNKGFIHKSPFITVNYNTDGNNKIGGNLYINKSAIIRNYASTSNSVIETVSDVKKEDNTPDALLNIHIYGKMLCNSGRSGGAILLDGGKLFVYEGAEFIGNSADYGGAIATDGDEHEGFSSLDTTIEILGGLFEYNTAFSGGAIALYQKELNGNSMLDDDENLYCIPRITLNMSGGVLRNNTASVWWGISLDDLQYAYGGGAITLLARYSYFNMYGGEISNNKTLDLENDGIVFKTSGHAISSTGIMLGEQKVNLYGGKIVNNGDNSAITEAISIRNDLLSYKLLFLFIFEATLDVNDRFYNSLPPSVQENPILKLLVKAHSNGEDLNIANASIIDLFFGTSMSDYYDLFFDLLPFMDGDKDNNPGLVIDLSKAYEVFKLLQSKEYGKPYPVLNVLSSEVEIGENQVITIATDVYAYFDSTLDSKIKINIYDNAPVGIKVIEYNDDISFVENEDFEIVTDTKYVSELGTAYYTSIPGKTYSATFKMVNSDGFTIDGITGVTLPDADYMIENYNWIIDETLKEKFCWFYNKYAGESTKCYPGEEIFLAEDTTFYGTYDLDGNANLIVDCNGGTFQGQDVWGDDAREENPWPIATYIDSNADYLFENLVKPEGEGKIIPAGITTEQIIGIADVAPDCAVYNSLDLVSGSYIVNPYYVLGDVTLYVLWAYDNNYNNIPDFLEVTIKINPNNGAFLEMEEQMLDKEGNFTLIVGEGTEFGIMHFTSLKLSIAYNSDNSDIKVLGFTDNEEVIGRIYNADTLPKDIDIYGWNKETYTAVKSSKSSPDASLEDDRSINEPDVIFYAVYYLDNSDGSDTLLTITVDANGGLFNYAPDDEGSTWVSVLDILAPNPLKLKYEDLQAYISNCFEATENNVILVGLTLDNDVKGKIYGAGDTLDEDKLINSELTLTGNTTIYAVWGYDNNGNSIPDYLEDISDDDDDDTAKTIELVFVPNKTYDKDALPNSIWDIKLVANQESVINRLNSADFTFVITNDNIGTDVAYEIIATNDEIVINPVNNSDNRFEFHYDGKTGTVTDTATEILLGTVKFDGYGSFEFKVDTTATENSDEAHATTKHDNKVDSFSVSAGTLIVNNLEENKDDDEYYGTINTEIFVPTQKLTVKVDFPNAVENQDVDYQQMTLTVYGGDLKTPLVINLGKESVISDYSSKTYVNKNDVSVTVSGLYEVVIEGLLAKDTFYTVSIEGAGYRSARYTVTMTEDKTINFWNNVKDNKFNVEEGKSESGKFTTFLAGDIVKDNEINIYDLSAVVSYFGSITLDDNVKNTKYAKYDLNRDGKIDSKDVAYVLVSWGK